MTVELDADRRWARAKRARKGVLALIAVAIYVWVSFAWANRLAEGGGEHRCGSYPLDDPAPFTTDSTTSSVPPTTEDDGASSTTTGPEVPTAGPGGVPPEIELRFGPSRSARERCFSLPVDGTVAPRAVVTSPSTEDGRTIDCKNTAGVPPDDTTAEPTLRVEEPPEGEEAEICVAASVSLIPRSGTFELRVGARPDDRAGAGSYRATITLLESDGSRRTVPVVVKLQERHLTYLTLVWGVPLAAVLGAGYIVFRFSGGKEGDGLRASLRRVRDHLITAQGVLTLALAASAAAGVWTANIQKDPTWGGDVSQWITAAGLLVGAAAGVSTFQVPGSPAPKDGDGKDPGKGDESVVPPPDRQRPTEV